MLKLKTDNKSRFIITNNVLICLILIVVGMSVYGRVSQHDFINFDDKIYVAENRNIRTGLTPENLAWAFSFAEKAGNYWQPLTWLSHMLDVDLYGLDPGRHHLTNVFFHIANAMLLFLALNRMTGARWRSAFVAGLFALHPLNVESVAWLAERKNVLSTFFWMLTLLTYAFYNERPGRIRYAALLIVFTLGLLAKPMLVTLPFVLLLLDFWPLKRIEIKAPLRSCLNSAGCLILEKLPLLILSGLSVYVSTASIKGVGNAITLQTVPILLRIENALVSYLKYIFKFVWPANLALYYPFPASIPLWQSVGALVLLTVISVGVLRSLRKHPYLAVGWLWYLGTLTPVIGWVQVGLWPAMADRWAYVPMVGLFMMIAWGIPRWGSRWDVKRVVFAVCASFILLILAISARLQTGHWVNSVAIFEHTLQVTDRNWVAHNNLASALNEQGRVDAAIRHYRLALLNGPPQPEGVHYNLAVALTYRGRFREAIAHYSEALKINPEYSAAHLNLGAVFARQGQTEEATRHYFEALQLEPNSAKAHYNLANIMLAQGKFDAAVRNYSQAVRIQPFFAEAYNGLGLALMQTGKLEAAIFNFRKAVSYKPSFKDGQRNLNLAESIFEKIDRATIGMHATLKFNLETPDLDLKMIELLEKKKKLQESLNEFQKTLSLQPGFTELDQNNITIVQEVKRKYEQKLDTFKQISELRPASAEAAYHIACIYARRGQMQQGVNWLNQAIEKGFDRRELLETDSDLKPIRDFENFQAGDKG